VTDTVLAYLESNDFIERDGGGTSGEDDNDDAAGAFTSAADLAEESGRDESLEATSLGHTVSRLYLDPMSAATIVHGLERANERPTALGLYQLVSRTPDMYELYLRSGEDEVRRTLYEREAELLGDAPSEFEEERFEDWLSALKTGKLLEDWAAETDEEQLTDRYKIGPGDLRGKVDTASGCSVRPSRSPRRSTASGQSPSARPVPASNTASANYSNSSGSVASAASALAGSTTRESRSPRTCGPRTRASFSACSKGKTAETIILENAGREDPSMDGVEPTSAGSAAGTAVEDSSRDADSDATTASRRTQTTVRRAWVISDGATRVPTRD